MKIVVFNIITSLLFIQSMYAQWELVLDKDDVKVWNKPSEDGYSFYKEIATANFPLPHVYSFFIDIENFPTWVNNSIEVKVLNRKENNYYKYANYFEMPWPVQNRFSVSEVRVLHICSDSVILRSEPAESHNISFEDALELTRYWESIKLYKKDDNTTIIKLEGAYDPAGHIPSWLVDKFLKYGPYDTMIKIREQLKSRPIIN